MKNNYRTGDGAGGGRADGMAQTSHQHFQPMYPSLSDSRVERDADLAGLMAKCARYMLDHGHDLTPKQKQLLRDVEKGRYQFKVLSQLLEIAPTIAANPLTLADSFRRATLVRMPAEPECLLDATIGETIAQANLDPWQMRLLSERTSSIADATLDHSGANLVRLQRYHDLVLRSDFTNGRRYSLPSVARTNQ